MNRRLNVEADLIRCEMMVDSVDVKVRVIDGRIEIMALSDMRNDMFGDPIEPNASCAVRRLVASGMLSPSATQETCAHDNCFRDTTCARGWADKSECRFFEDNTRRLVSTALLVPVSIFVITDRSEFEL